MIAHHRDLLAYVAEIGGEDGRVEPAQGHGHPQLCFRWGERDWRMGIAGSPSAGDASWRKREDIRRMLGLRGGKRVGARRLRRLRRAALPCRLPRLSGCTLPDWHEALARHPLVCRGNPALGTLIVAMLRHQVPGGIAEHPEIDAAFSALIYAHGPVRIGEVRR